jgi:hypothetical protein
MATGESDPIDILLGDAFFDDDPDDTSNAAKPRNDVEACNASRSPSLSLSHTHTHTHKQMLMCSTEKPVS